MQSAHKSECAGTSWYQAALHTQSSEPPTHEHTQKLKTPTVTLALPSAFCSQSTRRAYKGWLKKFSRSAHKTPRAPAWRQQVGDDTQTLIIMTVGRLLTIRMRVGGWKWSEQTLLIEERASRVVSGSWPKAFVFDDDSALVEWNQFAEMLFWY